VTCCAGPGADRSRPRVVNRSQSGRFVWLDFCYVMFMNCPYKLLAVSVANLLLACGGQADPTRFLGTGGAASGAGGRVNSGGVSSGGVSSGGVSSGGVSSGGVSSGGVSAGGIPSSGSGGALVCCDAFPVCPIGERQAQGTDCPANSSCHQITLCCSSIWCITNTGGGGGSGGSTGGGGGGSCNACTTTQACVAYRTIGGVRIAPEAGVCPGGTHLEGNDCQTDFVYECADLHGACAGQPVSCACAQPPTNSPGVCPVGYGSCSAPGASVDAAAQLVCQQLAP